MLGKLKYNIYFKLFKKLLIFNFLRNFHFSLEKVIQKQFK